MYPEIDFVIKENKDDSTILDEIRLLNDLPMYITCRDYLIRFKKLGEKHVIMPHVTGDLNKLKNLNEDQFGYNAFGLKDSVKLNYLEFPRELKKKYF